MPNFSVDNITQSFSGAVNSTADVSLPGGFVFQPSYLQAGLIVFLVFLLILMLGQLRHRFNHWTAKGAVPGIAFGFTFALVIEGLLLIGGRTALTEVLGWKTAPKPISNVLDAGRGKLVNVLGVTDTIDDAYANHEYTPEDSISIYQTLTPKQQDSVKSVICSDMIQ